MSGLIGIGTLCALGGCLWLICRKSRCKSHDNETKWIGSARRPPREDEP